MGKGEGENRAQNMILNVGEGISWISEVIAQEYNFRNISNYKI